MGRIQRLVQQLITTVVQGQQQHSDSAIRGVGGKDGTGGIGFPLLTGVRAPLVAGAGLGESGGTGVGGVSEGSQLDDMDGGRVGGTVGVGAGAGAGVGGGVDGGSDDEGLDVRKQVTSQGCSRVFIVKGIDLCVLLSVLGWFSFVQILMYQRHRSPTVSIALCPSSPTSPRRFSFFQFSYLSFLSFVTLLPSADQRKQLCARQAAAQHLHLRQGARQVLAAGRQGGWG